MSQLRLVSSDKTLVETWDAMFSAMLEVLEKSLPTNGACALEYLHGLPERGERKKERPDVGGWRVPATVHESSMLQIGQKA